MENRIGWKMKQTGRVLKYLALLYFGYCVFLTLSFLFVSGSAYQLLAAVAALLGGAWKYGGRWVAGPLFEGVGEIITLQTRAAALPAAEQAPADET